MYDIYGADLVVLPKFNPQAVLDILKKGYRKIYYRTCFKDEYRVLSLKWASPYLQQKFDTKFVHFENGCMFYGDLSEVYFSPRYSTDRASLKSYFEKKCCKDKTCTVVGAGIGPYSIILSSFFKSIKQYEINKKCQRYNLINCYYNCCDNLEYFNREYNGEEDFAIICMIPKASLDFLKKLNFQKIAVIYTHSEKEELSEKQRILEQWYNCNLKAYLVRGYSKTSGIYRFVLEKD